jgi:hypothetical protein
MTGIWREENPANERLQWLSSTPRACLRKPVLARVLCYLRSANGIAIEMGVERCLICENSDVGSGSLVSDGEWAWPDSLAHYVEKHFVVLDEKFLEKILSTAPATK